MEYIKEFINLLNEMSPYLLLGFLIAGILHVYIPQSIYKKHLSKPGFKSVLFGAIFGIPLPLCSCGVIPTAMSLRKEGASAGATSSFLIATPQTGVDSILATYALFGLPFTIIRPIVALTTALLGGILIDKSVKLDYVNQRDSETQLPHQETSKGKSFLNALRYGFVDMLQDIGVWLVIGLIVAGAITILVPDSFFATYADRPLINMLIILILSIPMYICATGSIPIALSLMLKGISPGAALVLLMAGPATNIASLVVLKKVLGLKITLLYLFSIITGAIGFGLLIDHLLPIEWFTSGLTDRYAFTHNDETAWWKILSSVIFCLLLTNALIKKYSNRHLCGHDHHTEIKETIYHTKGMRCNHCKINIEKGLNSLSNVESAIVDVQSGTIVIVGTATKDEIKTVVEGLGFKMQ